MSNVAIEIDSLGKQYRLGELQAYRTFRESLQTWIAAPFRKAKQVAQQATAGGSNGSPRAPETIWALKNISFDVKEGEVLGIIGHNGAGKSTLLKILSRITEPTTGLARIHGRVSSLLEVGTGFHPELTGRENVFLNGSILGMSRAEIRRKFDEIVEFSGVEKFLDTPVKRYSSGMQVRLAFAVAAHLEPEILIIDEVLAVGDAEFQKRCLGKMQDVAGTGRTVLFVSHNMPAIEAFCTRAVVLERGCHVSGGDVSTQIERYLRLSEASAASVDLSAHSGRRPSSKAILKRLDLRNDSGILTAKIPVGTNACFHVQLIPSAEIRDARIQIQVFSHRAEQMLRLDTRSQHAHRITIDSPTCAMAELRNCRLVPGQYSVTITISEGDSIVDQIQAASCFEVVPSDVYGTGRITQRHHGLFVPEGKWRFSNTVNGYASAHNVN